MSQNNNNSSIKQSKLDIISKIFSIIAAIATAGMVIFIAVQSCDIKKQTGAILNQTEYIGEQADILSKKFIMENRPYLYVVLKPLVGLTYSENGEASLLAGVFFSYANLGGYFAKEIEILDYELYSDENKDGYHDAIEQYWKEKYGTHSDINLVPSKQVIQLPEYAAGMGIFKTNERRYIQFSMSVKYKGFEEKDEYKYRVDYVYIVERNKKGELKNPIVLCSKHYFDNDISEEFPGKIEYLIDKYIEKTKE